MLRRFLLRSALLTLLSACTVDLHVPDDVAIECGSNADCPGDLECHPIRRLCVQPGFENSAPVVSIDPIARSVGDVVVVVRAVDLESDPVELAAWLDDAGTLSPLSISPATISGDGSPVEVRWDGGALLEPGTYRDDLRLRIVGSDGQLSSEEAWSERFAFGNELPAVTGPTPTARADGTVGGVSVIELTLLDGAGDTVTLTGLELSLTGTFDDVTNIPLTQIGQSEPLLAGLVDALESRSATGEPVAHFVVWDSRRTAVANSSTARLRLTLTDGWDADGDGLSDTLAVDSIPFTLVNQTPPRVEVEFVEQDPEMLNGAIPIVYRLIDEEGDASDVRFEYRIGDHGTWSDCSEYHSPMSEGTTGLASAPSGLESSGVLHAFIWDSFQDIAIPQGDVRIRLRARDLPLDPTYDFPAETESIIPSAWLVSDAPGQEAVDRVSLAAHSPVATAFLPNVGHAVADINGDGIPDILTSQETFDGGAVFLALGQTNGSIGAGQRIYPEYSPSPPWSASIMDLEVGDIDGDGDVDAVALVRKRETSTGSYFGALVVLRNEAGTLCGGTCPSAELIGPQFGDLAIGDLDGDDLVDLAVGDNASLSVWMAQPGGGGLTFCGSTCPDFTFARYADPLLATDVDGDGIADLIMTSDADPGGQLDLFASANAPAGPLSGTPVAVPLPGVVSEPGAVVAGDFDGDHRIDLARAQSTQAVSVALQGATGWTAMALRGGWRPFGVAAGDFNGDGIDDLASSNFGNDSITFYLSGRASGFAATPFRDVLSVAAAGSDRAVARMGDIDRDGRDALFLFTNGLGSSDQLLVARIDAVDWIRGRFAPVQTAGPTAYSSVLHAADWNGDGIPDLTTSDGALLAGAGWGPLGTGGLQAAVPFSTEPLPALRAVDLDGDGMLDRLAGGASGTLRVSYGADPSGVGDGTFSTPIDLSLSPISTPVMLVTHDVDGDGTLDIVAVTGSGDAQVLLGVPAGGFCVAGCPDSTVAFAGTEQPIAEDFDGDGLIDLAGGAGNDLLILRGSATAPFFAPPAATVAIGAATRGLAGADADADGDVDLLVVTAAALVTVLNDGGGAFTAAPGAATLPASAEGATWADLDGDGWAEWLVTTTPRDLNTAPAVVDDIPILGRPTGGFASPAPILDFGHNRALIVVGLQTGGLPLVAAPTESVYLSNEIFLHQPRRPLDGGWGWALRDSGPLGGGRVVGPLLVDRLSLFGDAYRLSYSQRPFVGDGTDGHGSVPVRGVQLRDFWTALRFSGLTVSYPLVPISVAWQVEGDYRWARVLASLLEGDAAQGERLRVERQLDLDLGATPRRGVVVELPVLGDVDRADLAGATLHVYARYPHWRRASDVAGDPAAGNADAANYLPRVPGTAPGDPARDVVQASWEWAELAPTDAASLENATEPSFAVEEISGRPVVLLIVDRFGVFQAFRE